MVVGRLARELRLEGLVVAQQRARLPHRARAVLARAPALHRLAVLVEASMVGPQDDEAIKKQVRWPLLALHPTYTPPLAVTWWTRSSSGCVTYRDA